MGKHISFTYQGEDYVLEFSKRTVKDLEEAGFNVNSIREKPMTMLPLLFEGAFKLHHRKLKTETINAIYKQLPNKEDLFNGLIELYSEPYESLLDEPDEKDEGNISWTMNG